MRQREIVDKNCKECNIPIARRCKTGRCWPCAMKYKSGKNNHEWKGENASKNAKHNWLKKWFGKATHCENDINHKGKVFDWANLKGHKYTRKREDYRMLCRRCHRILDYGNKCKKGHVYTPDNTYINPKGARICRICSRQRDKEFYHKHKKGS